MTAEEHLRVLIGDLVIRVAHLAAENDALHAKLREQEQDAGKAAKAVDA